MLAICAFVCQTPSWAAGTYYPKENQNYSGRFRGDNIPYGKLDWGRFNFKENVAYGGCAAGKRYRYSYRNASGWTESNIEFDLCNPYEIRRGVAGWSRSYTRYLWRRVNDPGKTCDLLVSSSRNLLHWTCSYLGIKQIAYLGGLPAERLEIWLQSPKRRLVRGSVGAEQPPGSYIDNDDEKMCSVIDQRCSDCGTKGIGCFKQRLMVPEPGSPGPTFLSGNVHAVHIRQQAVDGPHYVTSVHRQLWSFRDDRTGEWTHRNQLFLSPIYQLQWNGQVIQSKYRHTWKDDPGDGKREDFRYDFDYGPWVQACLDRMVPPGAPYNNLNLAANRTVQTFPGAFWCNTEQTQKPCSGREYEVPYTITCAYYGPWQNGPVS